MSRTVPGRVVHLSTVHHSWDNRIVNKECRALAEAGIDVHLVISADEDRVSHGVHVHAIRRRGRAKRLVLSQLEALGQLRRLRPSLLQIHDPELVPLALLWRRIGGATVVFDAHESLVDQIETKPYLNAVGKVAARLCARVLVGLADRGMDAMVAATATVAGGYPRQEVLVVRNVPWLRDFATEPAPTVGRAVYTGDLTVERGLPRMVEVMDILRSQGLSEAELLLAGRPLRSCVQTVADLPADGPVRHLGLLPPSEVPQLIASAQVGLIFLGRLPNYAESLPTKVFEYMAAGVPFLATDFPAWQELFGGHGAGVFVDTDDAQATAAALSEMLQDPAKCRRMGQRGREAVEAGFSFETEAPALVAFTRRLLEGS